MKHGMIVGRCFLALLGALTLLAQPAEARRFRFFAIPGFGGSESIDPVYDLPDREPFVKGGENMDVGWLNGRTNSGYVLYHGDRYIRLSDEGLTALIGVLGFDPTASHKAGKSGANAVQQAAQEAERKHKDLLITSGQMIEPREDESSEDYEARKNAFITRAKAHISAKEHGNSMPQSSTGDSGHFGYVTIAIMFFAVIGFGKKIIATLASRGSADSAPQLSTSHDPPTDSSSDGLEMQSFDAKIAARLAQLQSGERDAPSHAGSVAASQRAGFGRKGLSPSGGLG
jgi:hypothetical protein